MLPAALPFEYAQHHDTTVRTRRLRPRPTGTRVRRTG